MTGVVARNGHLPELRGPRQEPMDQLPHRLSTMLLPHDSHDFQFGPPHVYVTATAIACALVKSLDPNFDR